MGLVNKKLYISDLCQAKTGRLGLFTPVNGIHFRSVHPVLLVLFTLLQDSCQKLQAGDPGEVVKRGGRAVL